MDAYHLNLLVAALATAALFPAISQAASGGQELASNSGCLACHGLVHKQVGPGFAQVAERYRKDAEAAGRLAAKIRNGSVGEWGRVIMPRQAQVTPEQAKLLAAWVLSQPSLPSPATSSSPP